MQIDGLPAGMTVGELENEVRQGARFVMFQYTISVLIMTFKRPSDIHYIRPGESAAAKGAWYSFLTLFLGWWGIPWGPIYSIMSLYTNLTGGKDVTDEVMGTMR